MEWSEDQILRFEADGFLIVDRIIDDEQVERLLEAMVRVYGGTYNRDIRPLRMRKTIARFGTASTVHWILNARVVDGDLWNTATDPILGRAAAMLLRSATVSIVEDQLLAKPARGAPVNLHQDYAYWRFSNSTNMLSCWIALDDMTADMGPVELARGSHRWGFSSRPRQLIQGSSDGYLTALENVIPRTAALDLVPTIVPRGGGVFFHGLTFHGSRSNASGQWRRALSLHWAAAECYLDRSKLIDIDHPYLFSGLRHGDRLTNLYMPQIL